MAQSLSGFFSYILKKRIDNALIVFIILLMIVGFTLRLWYTMGYPLNGDEAGVTLLQASGQANTYDIRLPSKIAPLETFQQFIQSSGHFGLNDVTQSLKNAGLHPPLYYFIVYWILLLFGNQSFTLQLFSIIISLSSIP